MRAGRPALIAASALIAACAPLAAAPQTAMPTATAAVEPGYLTPADLTRLAAAVPAPFADGSAQEAADRAASDRYRALENGDRWLMATAHAELRPELALAHFDCAIGVRFGSTSTPRLTALFRKLVHDANGAAEIAKARTFRPRPVGVDRRRPACQRLTEAGRASPSWPSGSAAVGAAYGAALAVVAPDRAEAVRAIGHQIGVSRLVCGMHYPSGVVAGEVLGQAVFGEIAATPVFRADVEAARAELAQARATGLTNPGCAAERAALAVALP